MTSQTYGVYEAMVPSTRKGLGISQKYASSVIRVIRNHLRISFFYTISILVSIFFGAWLSSQLQRSIHGSETVDAMAVNISRQSPLIFIGGVPRSGTTLMRAILDAHPAVRCGQETRIIPRVLSLKYDLYSHDLEADRLYHAGVTGELFDDALASFILKIIAGHGEPAERLCNKDPLALQFMPYISKLFPNVKIIFMVRDGRAVVHSVISRNVSISQFDPSNPRMCLKQWNFLIEQMVNETKLVNPQNWLMVRYEELVLHLENELRRILEFLGLPWDAAVLHHEEYIGKDIALSKMEKSNDQIIKPVNLNALTSWVGTFPADVIRDMPNIAPMLEALGYDPTANPPNYGTPDPIILKQTNEVYANADKWKKKMDELEK